MCMGWCPSKLMPCSLRCLVFNWSANRRFASMLCGDWYAKWAKQRTNGRFMSCSLFQWQSGPCSLSLCISITINHTIHLCTCIQHCVGTNEENEDVLYVFVGLHAYLHVLRLCVSTHMFVCVCVPRRHEFQQEVKSCQLWWSPMLIIIAVKLVCSDELCMSRIGQIPFCMCMSSEQCANNMQCE